MRAKKHLGQNFLKSSTIARDIAEIADIKKSDIVVEIGPGTGILTHELLQYGSKIIAIEKDATLLPRLKDQFAHDGDAKNKNKKLILIKGDILDEKLLNSLSLENKKYKIVANIPYYITSQILRLFLSGEKQPTTMVLMVQKEVAERIVAQDGKESILSLSVKAYGEPRYIKKISARNFSPEPKVDSAILLIDKISKKNFQSPQMEALFFQLVKTGFAHKRKLLARNLEELFTKEKIEKAFLSCEIPNKIRAEKVPLEKWLCLLCP
ncbi:ribosomal RNA small subunit methyltransferase A [Patescibacteria group bacterium]|nr:ribosomal RNA small subunit methyltransferase A [Patescibacteria group bacterium]MBU1956089.1 ribosomal RNA small subunit methyltransferase A [Patescibacteria group bacterium]